MQTHSKYKYNSKYHVKLLLASAIQKCFLNSLSSRPRMKLNSIRVIVLSPFKSNSANVNGASTCGQNVTLTLVRIMTTVTPITFYVVSIYCTFRSQIFVGGAERYRSIANISDTFGKLSVIMEALHIKSYTLNYVNVNK